MKKIVKIGSALVLLWLCSAQAQYQPRLNGKTASEWRQVFRENGRLASAGSITSVTDHAVSVIGDLLQDDSRISTQLLNELSRMNIYTTTRSTNNLAKMVPLLPSIERHAFSTNRCRRMEAIGVLGSFGSFAKDRAGNVARLLDDKDCYIRAAAARTLASFGDAAILFLGKMREVCAMETNEFAIGRMKEAISRIEKAKESAKRLHYDPSTFL